MTDKLKLDIANAQGPSVVESLANLRKGFGGLRARLMPSKTHEQRVEALAEAKVNRINNAQAVKDITETVVQKAVLPILSTGFAVIVGASKGLVNLNKEVSAMLKEANAPAEAAPVVEEPAPNAGSDD